MMASSRCIELIKQFEGCSLTGYEDVRGKPTIGYGHCGLSVRVGDVITPMQATAYLGADVSRTADGVSEMFTIAPTQNQFDALVSLAYNIGLANLKDSTLLRKMHAGDIQGAADQFLVWDWAGGHQVEGLLKRRQAERALFLEAA